MLRKLLHRPFFIRLFNWEYWPFGAVYIWTLPAWIYFCFRARSFFFFTASNPSIENGGLLGESKKDIHAILPDDIYPRTIHFPEGTDGDRVLAALISARFSYPLIGKPDIGGRGRGVRILRNEQDVLEYARICLLDFHIQEYVDYPLEVGIFYYRFPGEETGRISGIVSKEFLRLRGNGKDDLLTLILEDRRSIMYLESLRRMHGERLLTVPAAGEEVLLSPFGNHARGSKFLDRTEWADQQFTDTIDRISKRIPDFYFGRFDIRYNSLEELKRGERFTVIELNGAGAEPTHIYDPSHSIFFAIGEIIRHWNILEKISRINHRRGIPYPSFREGRKIFRKDKEVSRKLEAMSD